VKVKMAESTSEGIFSGMSRDVVFIGVGEFNPVSESGEFF